MQGAEAVNVRSLQRARGSLLDAREALQEEADGLRRLARRALQDASRLQRAWLAACSEIPLLAAEDARHLRALERSLEPLCAALCHARLADAELQLTEL